MILKMPTGVEPNERYLLDITDLVFIDPVGTNFSRAAGERTQRPFTAVPPISSP